MEGSWDAEERAREEADGAIRLARVEPDAEVLDCLIVRAR